MIFKDFIIKLQRSIARNVFYALRWIISRIPYKIFEFFSQFFMLFGYMFMSKKKKLAMENLKNALGSEKSDDEINKIAKECFRNFGKGMIDLIYFIDKPNEIIKNVSIEGKEHLDQALSLGKGVVIVSAHFGSFILMYLRIILEGYKVNIIMREVHDKDFESYITKFRDEKGMKTIHALPAIQCVQKSLKALRKNEILFILLDQNFGGDGRIFVNFFGKKAATAAGPVVFSARTGCPILPMFIVKDLENEKIGSVDRHKIIIGEQIELDVMENKEEETIKNVEKLTKIIEMQVRKYPSQWGGWMHKRWKTRMEQKGLIHDEKLV